jgi:hypothetical protein
MGSLGLPVELPETGSRKVLHHVGVKRGQIAFSPSGSILPPPKKAGFLFNIVRQLDQITSKANKIESRTKPKH